MYRLMSKFSASCGPARRRVRGFSLVELLVVIGIIGVLIGILLPVVSRVRRQARATVCLSNLRQLHAAFSLYAEVNRGRAYSYEEPTGILLPQNWIDELELYQPFVADVRLCPDALERLESFSFGDVSHAWGRFANWMSVDDKACSYGANMWLNHINGQGTGGGLAAHGPLVAGPLQNYLSITSKDGSTIPLYGDASWYGAWPRATDAPPLNLLGFPFPPLTQQINHFVINRHHGAINVVFLDGHADRVHLLDLWTLKWHRGIAPPTLPIILPTN